MHVYTDAFQRWARMARPTGLTRWHRGARARAGANPHRCTDFAGATVQHCHILDHEALGMMWTALIEG